MKQNAYSYNYPLFSMLTSLFFIWGFITLLNDLLIPHLKALFHLNYVEAMLVQFCFFATYAIMSMPMAKLINRVGYKRGIIYGLIIIALGALCFIPAATLAIYWMFLFALFVLATGIVLLQVSANPSMTVIGPAKTAPSRLTLAQGINSLGYTIAPALVGSLIVAGALKMVYVVIAIIMLLTAWAISRFNFSSIQDSDQRLDKQEFVHVEKSVWRNFTVMFGAIAIFVYVGAEVSTGSVIVNLLHLPSIAAMSYAAAAKYLSFYWGGAMIGRLIGAWVLAKISPRISLAFNAIIAIVLLSAAMLLHGHAAMWCVLALGLFNSIMFPTIFSLVIADCKGDKLKKMASGVLCVAIVGGAFVPELQGFLADNIGLLHSFIVQISCYLIIILFAILTMLMQRQTGNTVNDTAASGAQ